MKISGWVTTTSFEEVRGFHTISLHLGAPIEGADVVFLTTSEKISLMLTEQSLDSLRNLAQTILSDVHYCQGPTDTICLLKPADGDMKLGGTTDRGYLVSVIMLNEKLFMIHIS